MKQLDRLLDLLIILILQADPKDWQNRQTRSLLLIGPSIGTLCSIVAFVIALRHQSLGMSLSYGALTGIAVWILWALNTGNMEMIRVLIAAWSGKKDGSTN